MAYDYDPYYDEQYGQQGNPFYNGGPPSITPNTAPTVDFQGQQMPNVTGQTAATGGYSGANDFRAIVQWWQTQHPAAAPDMPGLIAFLNSHGVQATTATHAGGLPSDDKILVNGQIYDLGTSLGSPSGAWFSNFSAMDEGGGGNDFAIDPSYLAPYTKEFNAPGDAALPQFQGPGAFKMPTGEDLAKDPSYLWEEGRIRDAVQNSASAAGTLNTSGTLDRIMGSVSDFARTNYNNIANRDYGIWNSDWQHALDAYDRQFGRSNSVYNRAIGEYDLGKQLFQSNQDRPFDKIFRGLDLGSRAASA